MKKLFYQDPYISSFTTNLLTQKEDELNQTYVVLEETAFYPTGGGQPNDTGTLNGIRVVNVDEVEGEVRHYVEQKLPSPLEEVVGNIDWERRFDHMQQHAGQHILSAVFEELFDINTIGFHLGTEFVTIDLDIEELTEDTAWKAEQRANQIILENRSIETKWITADEVSHYPMRKKPSVEENIRLVIIPDFDYNGCGGTHPSSTGQVSAIKILDWERQRKKTRLTFICGNRIRKELHKKNNVIKELSPLLNAPEKDMGKAVSRLLANIKQLEKSLEEKKEELLIHEGKELITTTENGLIGKVFEGRSIQELQKLARVIIAQKENSVVFLIALNGNQLQFVCAKGAAATGNMKMTAAEVLPILNGKGGGNESFAQGGGEARLTAEQLLSLLQEKL